jgi:hypothetical protein
VKNRLYHLVPPLRSGGIFQGKHQCRFGMIVSQRDRHPLPHAAPASSTKSLGTVSLLPGQRQKSAIEEHSLPFQEVLHDVFLARTCSSLTSTSNETAA